MRKTVISTAAIVVSLWAYCLVLLLSSAVDVNADADTTTTTTTTTTTGAANSAAAAVPTTTTTRITSHQEQEDEEVVEEEEDGRIFWEGETIPEGAWIDESIDVLPPPPSSISASTATTDQRRGRHLATVGKRRKVNPCDGDACVRTARTVCSEDGYTCWTIQRTKVPWRERYCRKYNCWKIEDTETVEDIIMGADSVTDVPSDLYDREQQERAATPKCEGSTKGRCRKNAYCKKNGSKYECVRPLCKNKEGAGCFLQPCCDGLICKTKFDPGKRRGDGPLVATCRKACASKVGESCAGRPCCPGSGLKCVYVNKPKKPRVYQCRRTKKKSTTRKRKSTTRQRRRPQMKKNKNKKKRQRRRIRQ